MDELVDLVQDVNLSTALDGMKDAMPTRRIPEPAPTFDLAAFATTACPSFQALISEPVGALLFQRYLTEQAITTPLADNGLHFDDFRAQSEYQKYLKVQWYLARPVGVEQMHVFRDLGCGAFGKVCAVKFAETGQMFAMKCMNRKLIKGKNAAKLVLGEKDVLQILGETPSRFSMSLRYSFSDAEYLYLIMPLMTGGDLRFHLRKDGAFDEARTRFYAAQIALGLRHLHGLGIVYRDLKPENILLDTDGYASISDLGLAVVPGGKKLSGRAGTPGYWPPEMLIKHSYSYAADWWSFGVVVAEMLCGFCLFTAEHTGCADRNEATSQWEIALPKLLDATTCDFIMQLLNRDKHRRLGARSADDVLRHAYFAGVDLDGMRNGTAVAPWKPAVSNETQYISFCFFGMI